ncbi:MAG: haloacid dehalogenase type II [Pseudomonadota bacterium]
MHIHGIVFDLYGTLYDVQAVAHACEDAFPTNGATLARRWRQKQLEYTWLRSLMGRYVDFEKLTAQALQYTCAEFGLDLDPATMRRLCDAWLHLPPFLDMPASIRRLRDAGLPLAVLSNGSHHTLGEVIGNSGMKWGFDHLISVEDVHVFKPHPQVYRLAEQRMITTRENLLFVSGNAWDASAARLFGFEVCWINRQQLPFDQLGATPTVELPDLGAMAEWVLAQSLK